MSTANSKQDPSRPGASRAPAGAKPSTGRARTSRKKAPAKKKAAPRKAAKKKAPAKKKAAPRKKPASRSAAGRKKEPRFDGNTSIRHCAEILNYSEPTIRKDIENNGAPIVVRASPGKAAVINVGAYHRFKLDQVRGEGNLLADTKLARQQEDLRKQKRENDIAEGKLVPIEDVAFAFNEFLVNLNNQLDGISGKAAAGDPVLRARYLDEIRAAKVGTVRALSSLLQEFASDTGEAILAAADEGELAVGPGEKDPS